MSKNWPVNLGTASATAVLALAALAAPQGAHADSLTGNIGVFSQYVLRGNTLDLESDVPALQGGLDYEHARGFYLGWWGSSLQYTDGGITGNRGQAFENNYYVGFASAIGGLSFDLGLIYYHYLGVDDADTPELFLGVGYGPVSLGVNYLLDDVVWGNAGDAYVTLGYEMDLPRGLAFGATLGYYFYDDGEGDFIAAADTTQSSAFRHLDLTLSRAIGESGADMSVTYILGGELRDGTRLGNALVLGLSYAFDL